MFEECIACEGTSRLHTSKEASPCTSTISCSGCSPCIICQTSEPTSPTIPEPQHNEQSIEKTPKMEESKSSGSLFQTVRVMKPVKTEIVSETSESLSASLNKVADEWMTADKTEIPPVNSETEDAVVEAKIETKERPSAPTIQPMKDDTMKAHRNTVKDPADSFSSIESSSISPKRSSMHTDRKRISETEQRGRTSTSSEHRRISIKEMQERISSTIRNAESVDTVNEEADVRTSQEIPGVKRKATIPRSGRKKRSEMVAGISTTNQPGGSNNSPGSSGGNSPMTSTPRSELQSVAGTLAKSKRYQRRGDTPNRKQADTTVTNRPIASHLAEGMNIKTVSGIIQEPEESTGESLDNIRESLGMKDLERTEESVHRRLSRVMVITDQLNVSSRTSTINRDEHTKSLEELNDEGVTTKRRTKIFTIEQMEKLNRDSRGKEKASARGLLVSSGDGKEKESVSISSLPTKSMENSIISNESIKAAKLSHKKNRFSSSIGNIFQKKNASSPSIDKLPEATAPVNLNEYSMFVDTPSEGTPDEYVLPIPIERKVTKISQHRAIASPITKGGARTPYRKFKSFSQWSSINVHSGSRVGVFKEAKYTDETIKLSDIVCTREDSASITLLNLIVIDTLSQLLWIGKCYEGQKNDQHWNAHVYKREEKETDEEDDEEEIKFRILDIFADQRLEGLEFSKDEKGTEYVSLGVPLDLLDSLIFPLSQDVLYAKTFLATYRFYIPAQRVLDTLIEWYNVDLYEDCELAEELFLKRNRKQIEGRAVKVLVLWIKNHWQDFAENKELFDELMTFVMNTEETNFGANQKLSQAIREQQYIPFFPTKKSATLIGKATALTADSVDFAKQLTFVDHFFFMQIRAGSYLTLMSKPSKMVGGGKNVALKLVMEYVLWFRMISSYTSSLIMLEDSVKKRMHAIKQMIKIAKGLRSVRNYNSLFAVMSGLKRAAILEMTSSWESLSTKHLDEFQELDALTSPNNGFINYFLEVEELSSPLVPFFSAQMQTLLEIDRVTPSQLDFTEDFDQPVENSNPLLNELPVNFEKFSAIYSIVLKMESFYKPYDMKLSTDIKHAENTYYTASQSSSSVEACTVFYNGINQWLLAHRVDDSDLDRLSEELKSAQEASKNTVAGVFTEIKTRENTELVDKRSSLFGVKPKPSSGGEGNNSMNVLSTVNKKLSVIGGSPLVQRKDAAAIPPPGAEGVKKQNRFSMLRK